ncbi:MAG: hypothetical protein EXQ56_05455 [Acidobacteria bacterium]|nr:hypothetical protein [Acidobacteriota bacterium]
MNLNHAETNKLQARHSSLLASGLTVAAALARLIPHPPNFTPVGGMSLYGGAKLSGWRAFAMPLTLMAITDVLLYYVNGYAAQGFHMFRFNTPFIYAAFLINVLIGRAMLKKFSVARLGGATLLCSTQFFLLTNFAVWLAPDSGAGMVMYPHTLAGLLTCYAAALPFFGTTLAGDALYTGVLFGLHAMAARTLTAKTATATA